MAHEPVTLPEGTVTVLSTDLVGSTLLNQRLGDEAATALEREIAELANIHIEKQRGVMITYAGDGLMVAFQSARRAVACAQEIQRGIARLNRSRPDLGLKLRIGLHTGEVVNDDGGLHGETLIIAKRIESVAPGESVYASDTVRGVLGTARGELEDRGEFELKGIDARVAAVGSAVAGQREYRCPAGFGTHAFRRPRPRASAAGARRGAGARRPRRARPRGRRSRCRQDPARRRGERRSTAAWVCACSSVAASISKERRLTCRPSSTSKRRRDK